MSSSHTFLEGIWPAKALLKPNTRQKRRDGNAGVRKKQCECYTSDDLREDGVFWPLLQEERREMLTGQSSVQTLRFPPLSCILWLAMARLGTSRRVAARTQVEARDGRAARENMQLKALLFCLVFCLRRPRSLSSSISFLIHHLLSPWPPCVARDLIVLVLVYSMSSNSPRSTRRSSSG